MSERSWTSRICASPSQEAVDFAARDKRFALLGLRGYSSDKFPAICSGNLSFGANSRKGDGFAHCETALIDLGPVPIDGFG
jgi:hypothetical protein